MQTQVDNSTVGTNLLTNLSSNWTQSWGGPPVGTPPTFGYTNARLRTIQTVSVISNSPYTISIGDDLFKFSWMDPPCTQRRPCER